MMSEQEEVSRPDEDIKETHLSGVSSGSPDKALRKQIEDKKNDRGQRGDRLRCQERDAIHSNDQFFCDMHWVCHRKFPE